MRLILRTIRERNDFIRKICSPFVKSVRFKMKSDALKIDDFAILSLAHQKRSKSFRKPSPVSKRASDSKSSAAPGKFDADIRIDKGGFGAAFRWACILCSCEH